MFYKSWKKLSSFTAPPSSMQRIMLFLTEKMLYGHFKAWELPILETPRHGFGYRMCLTLPIDKVHPEVCLTKKNYKFLFWYITNFRLMLDIVSYMINLSAEIEPKKSEIRLFGSILRLKIWVLNESNTDSYQPWTDVIYSM